MTPQTVTALVAAISLAWVLALLLKRALRGALERLVGRGAAPGPIPDLLRGPLRLVFYALFVILAALLAFPALELAGRKTNIGFDRGQIFAWTLQSGVRILFIAALAWLVVRVVRSMALLIEQEAARGTTSGAIERAKRVRTLGSLVSNTVAVALWTAAALMILRELRVDIMPLLTGAGIVGLAVGFGAQSLVKDVISGFFVILENQVRVGDVANINGTGGLVEAVTLRTIVLRDQHGTVHVFPNGSITTLANLSKDFSYAVLEVRVTYKADLDQVFEVMREVGADVARDPALSAVILAPLELLGVDGLQDSAVLITARFKTLPLQQWNVAREYRRRLKKALDSAGIGFPLPHTIVDVVPPHLAAATRQVAEDPSSS